MSPHVVQTIMGAGLKYSGAKIRFQREQELTRIYFKITKDKTKLSIYFTGLLFRNKGTIAQNLEKVRTVQGSLEVAGRDIMKVIENFKEEANHADLKMRKAASRKLPS